MFRDLLMFGALHWGATDRRIVLVCLTDEQEAAIRKGLAKNLRDLTNLREGRTEEELDSFEKKLFKVLRECGVDEESALRLIDCPALLGRAVGKILKKI